MGEPGGLKDFLEQNPNANTGIELRFFANDVEKERVFKTQHFRPPHIRAASTLVAPIGVMWEPGCYQKTIDMVIKANKVGVCTWFHEITDINAGIPYAHLNMMRDTVCTYAHNAGFEWILLIENDCLPEEDMLLNLLKWDMPIVVPYIVDEKYGKPICAPYYKPQSGLKPIQWAVFTCILINTRVLNCFPFAQPFNTVGIESGFYQKLAYFGHRAYQDTNTQLKLARRPAYPVDHGGLEAEWKCWVELDKKRRRVPDRAPIDPDDKRQVNGIYMPLGAENVAGIRGTDEPKKTEGTESQAGSGVPGNTKPHRPKKKRAKRTKN